MEPVVEVVGWDDVKARPIRAISPKRVSSTQRKKSPKKAAGASLLAKRKSTGACMSDADIFNNKSSDEDMKLLTESLQSWSKSIRGASMGLNDDCLIVVPSRLSRWASESFGFRVEGSRTGDACCFLRCSKEAGRDALTILLRILDDCEAGRSPSSTNGNAISSPKRRKTHDRMDVCHTNTNDWSNTVTPPRKKTPRWLSGSSRGGYGKKQPTSVASISPCTDDLTCARVESSKRFRSTSTSSGKLSGVRQLALFSDNVDGMSERYDNEEPQRSRARGDSTEQLLQSTVKKQKKELDRLRNELTKTNRRLESSANQEEMMRTAYAEELEQVKHNMSKTYAGTIERLKTGSEESRKMELEKYKKKLENLQDQLKEEVSNQEAIRKMSYAKGIEFAEKKGEVRLERLYNQLKVASKRHAAEVADLEAKLKTSYAKGIESAKKESDAGLQRIKHEMDKTHSIAIEQQKSNLKQSHSDELERYKKKLEGLQNELTVSSESHAKALADLEVKLKTSYTKECEARVERAMNEMSKRHTSTIERLKSDFEATNKCHERELERLSDKHKAELEQAKLSHKKETKRKRGKNQINSLLNFDSLSGENGMKYKDITHSKRNQKATFPRQSARYDDSDEEDADAEKQKYRDALSEAVVREKPNVKWDDVAGLVQAKDSLKETVILPTMFPQMFTGKRKPFKGILLYGPPGTGKSLLAKAVATEADSTFFSVSSSDVISKWQGESERLVRNLFEMAREAPGSRAIIFIDEVDSLCGSRSENDDDSTRRIKTEFLVQMDGVGNKEGDVLVLGATNLPWDLDSAFRRRFEKRVYIPLPDQEARTAMVKIHLGDTPNNLSEHDFDMFGRLTEGASGSDIKVLVKEALMEPVRQCKKAQQFLPVGEFLMPCEQHPNCQHCPTDPLNTNYDCSKCGAKRMQLWDVPPEKLKAPNVCVKDFENRLRRSHSTVSEEELDKYTKWTKQFGDEGS